MHDFIHGAHDRIIRKLASKSTAMFGPSASRTPLADLIARIGSYGQRLCIVPSQKPVIVRLAKDSKPNDARLLKLLFFRDHETSAATYLLNGQLPLSHQYYHMKLSPNGLDNIIAALAFFGASPIAVVLLFDLSEDLEQRLIWLGIGSFLIVFLGSFLFDELKCPSCGKRVLNRGRHIHCTNCGAKASGSGCLHCGHRRSYAPRTRGYSLKFCHSCGARLDKCCW